MISGERSKYLQETIITQRNGRFVVPVKAEHRGDVPGLVARHLVHRRYRVRRAAAGR